ncbi:MAG: hypothetical protein R3D70_05790 [Rhizobiaceae bacterium]
MAGLVGQAQLVALFSQEVGGSGVAGNLGHAGSAKKRENAGEDEKSAFEEIEQIGTLSLEQLNHERKVSTNKIGEASALRFPSYKEYSYEYPSY